MKIKSNWHVVPASMNPSESPQCKIDVQTPMFHDNHLQEDAKQIKLIKSVSK